MRGRLLLQRIATAAILSGFAWAQAQVVPGFAQPSSLTPGFAGFGISSTAGFDGNFPHHSPVGSPLIFFSDLGYEPVPTQPVSVIVIQPPAPAAASREEEHHPLVKPLLLELQGDHWVQVDYFQMASTPVTTHGSKATQQHENALAETLLIFRDGHSEATRGYAVIGDSLYEQTDYWNSGRWTRKVAIADLDLPATIQANRQRGASFKMPTGPNEVVLQP
jgi:hypothetical protein